MNQRTRTQRMVCSKELFARGKIFAFRLYAFVVINVILKAKFKGGNEKQNITRFVGPLPMFRLILVWKPGCIRQVGE